MDRHLTPGPTALEPSDERLFAVIVGKEDVDDAALRELIDRYQSRLYAYAYRWLHHVTDAEDAVQETFIRALRYAKSFKPEHDNSFKNWIYAIARRVSIDMLNQRHPMEDVDAIKEREDLEGNEGSAELQTSDLADRLSDRIMVESAMDRLPASDRTLLHLAYAEDVSLNDLAKILDISLSATKVRLHRARLRFKKILLNP